MTGPEVLDVAHDAMWTMLIVSTPVMIIGLVIGTVIALFQALTQIQEMTLTFLPKMIAMFLALLVLFPFMATSLGDLMQRLADRIAAGG
jgi:flagellar biosynthesis protein FliQ